MYIMSLSRHDINLRTCVRACVRVCVFMEIILLESWLVNRGKDTTIVISTLLTSWVDPEGWGGGEQGVRTPLKNPKNIGFPSNIDPDPVKITKLPSQHSIVGHYRHANNVSLAGR